MMSNRRSKRAFSAIDLPFMAVGFAGAALAMYADPGPEADPGVGPDAYPDRDVVLVGHGGLLPAFRRKHDGSISELIALGVDVIEIDRGRVGHVGAAPRR